MTLSVLVIGGTVLVLLVQIWTDAQRRAAIDRLDDRMTHLLAAMSLLTDTTEGGLRDVASEVGRLAGAQSVAAAPKSRTTVQRRVRAAARRGRTVQEIAAAEEMAEGEVRLRLNMEKDGRTAHAALR